MPQNSIFTRLPWSEILSKKPWLRKNIAKTSRRRLRIQTFPLFQRELLQFWSRQTSWPKSRSPKRSSCLKFRQCFTGFHRRSQHCCWCTVFMTKSRCTYVKRASCRSSLCTVTRAICRTVLTHDSSSTEHPVRTVYSWKTSLLGFLQMKGPARSLITSKSRPLPYSRPSSWPRQNKRSRRTLPVLT